MHNLIVEKTLAALPALQILSEGKVPAAQIREAFRAATRQAFAEEAAAPGAGATNPERKKDLEEQLDELLDDSHLALLERRFRSLRALLARAVIPPASELEGLFVSWGIDPAEAHQAALFAQIALDPEAHSEPGGTVSTATAETCFAAAVSEAMNSGPASELRELAATSLTLGMVYELYCSSASLWQGTTTQSSFKEEKLEMTLTIVMDAEGGLGGLLFGPIGAILGSAVYSILWVATGP